MKKAALFSTALVLLLAAETNSTIGQQCKYNIDKKAGQGDAVQFPYWPMANSKGQILDRDYVSQGYGQFWQHDSIKDKLLQFHAAFDIAPTINNPDAIAVAVAKGWVATLIENGESDHGFGNTVIINVGPNLYAMYAHLASWGTEESAVKKNCTFVQKTITYKNGEELYVQEYECPSSTAAPISAGQNLGVVGDTGTEGGIHLHFEVRHFASLIWDDALPPDGFGYTKCYPSEDKYKDPSLHLDGTSRVYRPYKVKVTSDGAGQPLRLGPNSKYKNDLYGVSLVARKDEEFYVQKKSAGQVDDGKCLNGWVGVTTGSDWPGNTDYYNSLYFDIGFDGTTENYGSSGNRVGDFGRS